LKPPATIREKVGRTTLRAEKGGEGVENVKSVEEFHSSTGKRGRRVWSFFDSDPEIKKKGGGERRGDKEACITVKSGSVEARMNWPCMFGWPKQVMEEKIHGER